MKCYCNGAVHDMTAEEIAAFEAECAALRARAVAAVETQSKGATVTSALEAEVSALRARLDAFEASLVATAQEYVQGDGA